MLIAFFLVPVLIYIAIYIFKPKFRGFLPIAGCLIIALTSLLTLFYAVNSAELWKSGERIVWSGFKSKTSEIEIGGNSETAIMGWVNGNFTPKVKAKIDNKQTTLEISDGGGFVQDVKTGKFLNGEEISLNETNFNDFTIKKTESLVCGNSLEIFKSGKLTVQIFLPKLSKDKAYNFDSIIERATQNLNLKGEKRNEWICQPNYVLSFEERLKLVESLKLLTGDARLLITKNGEIRFLTAQKSEQKSCENPCNIKILWANSSLSAEIDKSQQNNLLTLKYLPPYRNFSPIPKDTEAKQQLIVTGQVLIGDYAYTLPLGKREAGLRKKLDFTQINETIPEPYEKTQQSLCESPTCKFIEGQNLDFSFIRVKDLPSFTWIVIFSILPFLLFVSGLFLIKPNVPLKMQCLISGFIAVIWNFLIFRILLAIRYSLDPAYLDEHSIGDLTLSFAGLVFLPAFLFLLVRLRNDSYRELKIEPENNEANRLMISCLVYLGSIISFFFIEIWYVQTLWENLPKTFNFSLGWKFGIALPLFFAYLILHIIIFYLHKQGKIFKDEHTVLRILKFIFIGVWNSPKDFVKLSRQTWQEIFSGTNMFLRRILVISIIYTGLAVITFFIILPFFGKDFLPLIYCLVPTIFWLSAKSILKKDLLYDKSSWWKILIISLTFVPFVLLPIIVHDAGSIYVNFFILLILACLLIKKANGSRVFGVFTGSFAVLGLIFIFIFLLNFSAFFGIAKVFGETTPRVLAWKHGSDFQHFLLASDAGTNDNQIGLNFYDITNVRQHTWENQAIANNGGFIGNGFGNAPVRLSQIRADTIQFDSVFSFFVVGDFGWLGGMFLLLIYFVPFILVFLYGRSERFDVGLSVALIISGLFLFEGLLHASMNLGVAPFTGRNLPLLSVHSFNGDFLRWTVLFTFLINAIFWHNQREEICLMTNEAGRDKDLSVQKTFKPVVGEEGKRPSTLKKLQYYYKSLFENYLESWKQIICLTFFTALFFSVTAIYGFFYVYLNPNLEVFNWSLLKDDVDWAISKKMIKTVQDEGESSKKCPKIILDEQLYRLKWNDDPQNNSFLNQQIEYFNALTCEERIGEGVFPNISTNLQKVTNFAEYQGFLNNLRENDVPARRVKRPNLLTVERIGKYQRETDDSLGFAVHFNPEFNLERTFNQSQSKDNLPTIKIGDNPLLGVAWDKGKYVSAVDNSQILSWTDWLVGSMNLEWKRLGANAAARKYGKLTLDEKLHNQTLNFTDKKGVTQQKQKLAAGGKDYQEKLPPRIGLTVMKLSNKADNGAILALGSFPRTVSGNNWQKIQVGQDSMWLPPAKIVEKRFPPYLKQLYGGDRNFEKVSVMGSSTKPMWAEAVLSVHLDIPLSNKFKVLGSPIDDDSVFGIKIAKENEHWKGHGSSQQLVNFDTFLTESNNRYQVLFGFLGLAESKEKQTSIPTEANSPSRLEVMEGTKLWLKYPKFDEQISFNSKNPSAMAKLDKTELAMRMRRIFGVGTKERENINDKEDFSPYFNSFWTKDENDDALKKFDGETDSPKINEDLRRHFSPAILPARVNLRLNKIEKPRDFVTLLLGGGENQWSNVHATAGFTTAIIGRPVLPHIVKNEDTPIFYGRADDFITLAKQLRTGLSGVVFAKNGTANSKLNESGALNFLTDLKQAGFQVYAKTGTLTEDGNDDTSRIILTIVQFEDAEQTKINKGLSFSLFIEETTIGTASSWLGEYLMENKAEILRLLETKSQENQTIKKQTQSRKQSK
jgi:cell division protein FtsW (lipid II flippase)